MTPLIDVTNSGRRSHESDLSKDVNKRGNSKASRNKSLTKSLHESVDGNSSDGSVYTHKGDEVNMCNTRLRRRTSSNLEWQGSCSINHEHSLTDCMRVPPLPETADDILSHAVQALNLNVPVTYKKRDLNTKKHFRQRHSQGGQSIVKAVNVNSGGLPNKTNGNDVLRTPQQCGACGLEFTSLPVLTQHLTRHVYDGLYAAQWLTQAMALTVPFPSPSDSSRGQEQEGSAVHSHSGEVSGTNKRETIVQKST
ncbi:hypothetical protein SK128_014753 [Halocaridina rubra]|uniref:C2H2-type domain-containing protein n=1 Tax=Halocaridina rubra TaxID=373956 RepID=A0AAN8WQ19_HALRR